MALKGYLSKYRIAIFLIFSVGFLELIYTYNNKEDYIDEPLWAVESVIGEHYLSGNFVTPDWSHFYSYDHPNFYKIFNALWLKILNNPVSLEKFSPSIDTDSHSLDKGEYYYVETLKNSHFTFEEYKKVRDDIRKSGFLIYPLFAVLFLLILERLKIHNFIKIFIFAIPILNPLFVNYFTNCGSEAFIALMCLLTLYASLTQNISFFTFAAGLAIATKFTLLFVLIFPFLFENQWNKKKFISYVLSYLGIFIIFYSLNPFLWPSPFKNLFFMLEHRKQLTSFQFRMFMSLNDYSYFFVRTNLFMAIIKEYFFKSYLVGIIIFLAPILNIERGARSYKFFHLFAIIFSIFLILSIPGFKDTYPRHFITGYILLLLSAAITYSNFLSKRLKE